jgi:hypothetical protein
LGLVCSNDFQRNNYDSLYVSLVQRIFKEIP